MFSVIIPVYNKEHCVERTINSVLAQTYGDFEIIIVDDGSTDNSLRVVSAINDNRIKVFHKENEGVSIARNYGVERAEGEYICFLDADDEWENCFLRLMNEAIQRYPHHSFFTCPFLAKNKYKETLYKIEGRNGDTFVIEDYCKTFVEQRHAICCVGSVCIRKDILISCGMFPPHVKRGEDHDLWLRLACKTSIVYTNRTKLIYNLDSENNSRSTYRSYKDSFPYWQWYDYPYPVKKSLYRLVSYFLLSHAWSALRHWNVKSAWAIASRVKLCC